ncbi:MAG TPA: hypothetical protein VKA10_09445 [Prolixibacteraceae bacterium]|nr:hypothetical protein [Prolixibacteraceae bacterium]
MKIDRNNYEAYFIDYLEGNLDESLVDEFIEFVNQNPDLKQEIQLYKSVSLHPETTVFNRKDALYKEKFDKEEEFNRAAIAQIEGELEGGEKGAFKDYISRHPEKEKEAALFALTKLKPDESIKFRNKNKLYHRSAGSTILLWSGRVAAVLVLALSVYLFTDNISKDIPENQMAVVKKKSREQEKTTPANIAEKATKNTTKTEMGEQLDETVSEPQKSEITNKKPVGDEITLPQKLLAENNEVEKEQISKQRIPVEIPSKINTLSAQIEIQNPQAMLASVDHDYAQSPVQPTGIEGQLIGDVIREKAGLDNLSLNKITKVGLNLVSSFSKENFTYETNTSGKITEVNFDSRLLAFSIPTNNSGE